MARDQGADVEQQVQAWRKDGTAASTIRHRLSALSQLYKVLDGKRARNPVATVERPVEPKPGANALPLEVLLKVFAALAARIEQNNRGWKTLARAKVIAFTGMRHSQVMRLTPNDLWLDSTPPLVSVNQAGKGGKAHWKPLTEDGVEAFRLFVEKNAFGKFSQSSLYKSWKLACEDAGVTFFNPTGFGTHGRRRCEPGEWTSLTCRRLLGTLARRPRSGMRWLPQPS